MLCPYCNLKMLDGNLVGDRYANVWESNDSKTKPNTISLKRGSYFKFKSIKNEAFVCASCNKLIIDLNTEADKSRLK